MLSFSENRTICRSSGKALENSITANPAAPASKSQLVAKCLADVGLFRLARTRKSITSLFASQTYYSEIATPLGVALSVEKNFSLILKVPFGTKYLNR
jgi:hypothetical protein